MVSITKKTVMKLLIPISLLVLFSCGSYEKKQAMREPQSPEGIRNIDNIRISMQNAKVGIYSIYLDHRKIQPTAEGSFRFFFTINPNGGVENLELLESEITDRLFIENVLRKIKSINFGAENVETSKVEYTFIFIPN